MTLGLGILAAYGLLLDPTELSAGVRDCSDLLLSVELSTSKFPDQSESALQKGKYGTSWVDKATTNRTCRRGVSVLLDLPSDGLM